jgi:hypothetical protein
VKRVFLAGEGRNELGGWADLPPYRSADGPFGTLVSLLKKVAPGGWEAAGAVTWRAIRKYRAGEHRRPETRNVLGAGQMAREAGCEVLAFTRDRDRSRERQEEIEAGLIEVGRLSVEAIGGVAIESLEAWLLALGGRAGTEGISKPKEELSKDGITTTADLVARIEEADLARLPEDATSLHLWLGRAREVLGS